MHRSINGAQDDCLLTEVEAARVLSLSSRTLQAWRCRGFGPRFVRLGRAVRYTRQELKDWVAQQSPGYSLASAVDTNG